MSAPSSMTALPEDAVIATPNALPIPVTRRVLLMDFPLVRYFGAASLVVFVLVISVIAWKSRDISRATLVSVEESVNIEVAHVLANQFSLFGAGHGSGEQSVASKLSGMAPRDLVASREFNLLDQAIRSAIVDSGVLKIKIYDPEGATVYSTETAQIGQSYRTQPGFVHALSGGTHSEFVTRENFNSVRGVINRAEIVQTYLPIRIQGSKDVSWVFEIYSDASQGLRLIAQMHHEAANWLFGAMGLLFLFVYLAFGKGERLLREQSREREDVLRRMGAKERELENRKSVFLAAATHELRTPMTSILGFAELLESRHYDPARVRALAGTIRAQSQAMTCLLDDLLDITALDEKESMAVRPVLCRIEPLIHSAVQRVDSPSLDRRIAVRVEPGLPDMLLDGMRFTQAITNILSNACKYSPPASEVAVEVFRDRSPGAHRIGVSVTDHGSGMTQEDVSKIFTRFWRSDRTSAIKGTGLGMVIVKLIIDRHGGSIEVDSKPDEGTRVTVWLNERSRTDSPGQ